MVIRKKKIKDSFECFGCKKESNGIYFEICEDKFCCECAATVLSDFLVYVDVSENKQNIEVFFNNETKAK